MVRMRREPLHAEEKTYHSGRVHQQATVSGGIHLLPRRLVGRFRRRGGLGRRSLRGHFAPLVPRCARPCYPLSREEGGCPIRRECLHPAWPALLLVSASSLYQASLQALTAAAQRREVVASDGRRNAVRRQFMIAGGGNEARQSAPVCLSRSGRSPLAQVSPPTLS